MTKIVMIADDLTGANANCSLMKKIGLSASSILNLKGDLPKGIDVLAYTTNSRAIEKDEAYKAVKEALDKMASDEVMLYSKRVDSTLRGNLGSELNAIFDSLGEEYIGICAAAYPDTNRVIFNGTMLVNGSLLMNTDAGKDAKTPVFSNEVEELFNKDLKVGSVSIFLEDIEKGSDHVAEIIKNEKKLGNRLIIFDGVTNEHLEIVADACVKSKEKIFSIDPGPFSMRLADRMIKNQGTVAKVLMVVGSVTDITIKQIKEVTFEYPVDILEVNPLKLLDKNKIDEYVEQTVKDAKDRLSNSNILMITSTPYREGLERLNLVEISKEKNISVDDLSIMISNGLARIAKEILDLGLSFSGIFSSGGDITVALTEYAGATGIEIREEIIPLAAYGRMIGGDFPSLRIISKGGMVGNESAMITCLEKLMNV